MPVLHTPRRPTRPFAASSAAARAVAALLAAAALCAPAATHPAAAAPVPARPAASGPAARSAPAAAPAADAPAPAADDPGWTAGPAAGPAVRPDGVRPYFYLAGAPGTVLEDRLALTNTSDRARTVTLRGADAGDTPEGGPAVRPAREPAGAGAGAGAWFAFGPGATVTVPPRTRAVVPFTVTLPPSAPPGDHPAAVVAAEAGREAAVRVHLRVGGPSLAALTVEDVTVRGRGAATEVAYTLVNRGNTVLAPALSLRARGRFGALPGRPAHALPVELLPGQRVALTEPWPGAPALDRARVTLTATAPGGARASGGADAWFVPWRAAGRTGAGLLLLAAAVGAALYLLRARRTRQDPPAPGRDTPCDGTPARPGPVRAPEHAPEHELTGVPR
ncbi:hypothetical protein [Streptomyces subrutilus]|uniref:hypothetical protein n=1 Tax=Streptomyces subrutilus TaxID=36818 RepID=UPI0033C0D8B8